MQHPPLQQPDSGSVTLQSVGKKGFKHASPNNHIQLSPRPQGNGHCTSWTQESASVAKHAPAYPPQTSPKNIHATGLSPRPQGGKTLHCFRWTQESACRRICAQIYPADNFQKVHTTGFSPRPQAERHCNAVHFLITGECLCRRMPGSSPPHAPALLCRVGYTASCSCQGWALWRCRS